MEEEVEKYKVEEAKKGSHIGRREPTSKPVGENARQLVSVCFFAHIPSHGKLQSIVSWCFILTLGGPR